METKRRGMLWTLRIMLALSILGIVLVVLRLALQARHAAQLAALGVPDLCDPSHIGEYAALMFCSRFGILSTAGLSWLHRKV